MGKRKSKRANGEGSIYRRKDGYYVGQYVAHPGDGPKYRYIYAKSQAEALRKLREAMAERDAGLAVDAGRTTVGEYLDLWLSDTVADSVKPATLESYSRLVSGHLVPILGRKKLKDLTPDHVRGFRRSKLDTGLSARTVQYLLVLLRKALQQAVDDGLIRRNVARGVKTPPVGNEEISPLTPEQAGALLEAAARDRLEALYVVAVHTGLRQGELLGLRWEDLDLDAGTLSVRRTLSGNEGGRPVFSAPKTARSRRTVRLTSQAVRALKRHRKAQDEEAASAGPDWPDNGLVFRATTGTPLNRHNLVRRSFKPLLGAVGLPSTTRFHDLRHTCATILLSKGVHPKFVQELLGHATVSITLDVYSHVIPGMGDQVVSAMEDALAQR